MSKDLEKYLLAAIGKEKDSLPSDNPYRDVGFDGEKRRLGWILPASFIEIEKSLRALAPILENKETFIFVGMGGSINGIKPLLSLFKNKQFYTFDNLDPKAASELISKVADFNKTLVVSISKSGTTKETQLLAKTLQELFSKKLGSDQWQKNFLWLSDKPSFDKLNDLGWQGVAKTPIQFDSETDIGGRFSSPHTCIFFLPLFLLLGQDLDKLKNVYDDFVSLQEATRAEACRKVEQYRDTKEAYFSPLIDEILGKSFSSWIVQLFQESLGSKSTQLAVKTITNLKDTDQFCSLSLDLEISDKVVELMEQMYFFQVFIAYYSALKGINFVTQEFVEKYKQEMGRLEGASGENQSPQVVNLEDIIKDLRSKITERQCFIEVVLYFYPDSEFIEATKSRLEKEFPDKQVLVFVGSDWNHQSYQAAFGAKDTFYVLLTLDQYAQRASVVSEATNDRNIGALKLIAQATYLTLKDKSIFSVFK
ncbi:MAG: hypothetical protein K9L86_01230 [Candidatus Omnitrophica bacterium]|nr:hypothetical protein [Candidatus Omnitrophota bacterium]